MSMSPYLPHVLQIPCCTLGYSNSISLERVLKRTHELLLNAELPGVEEDEIIALLDTLTAMRKAIR